MRVAHGSGFRGAGAGSACLRQLWSPTPGEHQAVARRTIKGCSQAGHVSIGVFMMLL